MHALLLAAMLSTQAADLTTSCVAFSRGYQEMNPVVPTNCKAAIGITAAVDAIGIPLAERKLSRPIRFALYAAVTVVELKATIHNGRQLTSARQPQVSVSVPTCVWFGAACQ
jgi:hypothetical protein